MRYQPPKNPVRTLVCLCGREFSTRKQNVKYCPSCRVIDPSVSPVVEVKSCRFFGEARETWKAKREKKKQLQRFKKTRDYRLQMYGIEVGHTNQQWMTILKFQNFRCYYCRVDLDRYNWSRDHRTPLSRGGSDDISNIVAVCRSCNSRKGTKTEQEFINKLFPKKKEVLTGEIFFSDSMTSHSLKPTSTLSYSEEDLHRLSVQRDVARFEARQNIQSAPSDE